jgi:type II secretory pathway pseudopilin PulG
MRRRAKGDHTVRKHRGFTMIEIIVVITIIIILMTMLVVGLRIVSASSKEKSTRITLANAQAMLAEFETTAGASRLVMDADGDSKIDGAVAAPGSVVEGTTDRTGDAVKKTAAVFAALRSVPRNKSSMDQLPADQLLNINYSGAAWAPVFLDSWNNPILFVPAPVVVPRQPDGTAANDPDPPNWTERYGLTGVKLQDNATAYRVVNPGGLDINNSYPSSPDWNDPVEVNNRITRLRHYRPFFVSAGPDGDFRTHDDNLYSFEN